MVCLFIIFSFEAHSANDGIKLLKACKSADLSMDSIVTNKESYVNDAYCIGLIRGIYYSIGTFGQEQLKTSFPDKAIGVHQQIKVVVHWIEIIQRTT